MLSSVRALRGVVIGMVHGFCFACLHFDSILRDKEVLEDVVVDCTPSH